VGKVLCPCILNQHTTYRVKIRDVLVHDVIFSVVIKTILLTTYRRLILLGMIEHCTPSVATLKGEYDDEHTNAGNGDRL